MARSRRRTAGPVVVYGATGRLPWPSPLRWSLVEGCEDQREASRRAFTLVEAAAVRVEAGSSGGAGNDRVFRERAVVVLTAYLVAAAVSGASVDDIRAWSTEPPEPRNEDGRPARRLPANPRPVKILHDAGRKRGQRHVDGREAVELGEELLARERKQMHSSAAAGQQQPEPTTPGPIRARAGPATRRTRTPRLRSVDHYRVRCTTASRDQIGVQVDQAQYRRSCATVQTPFALISKARSERSTVFWMLHRYCPSAAG